MTDNNKNLNHDAESKAENKHIDVQSLISVKVSSDCMTAYVLISKPEAKNVVITKEDILQGVEKAGVKYGINRDSVEKLAKRPIYNLKLKIGEGTPPKNGKDGFVDFFVVRDSEYVPEISQNENVDFKNLAYFQMVKEGQMLCAIMPPEKGVDGKDVYGKEIPAKEGQPAKSPKGKNTSFNEAGDFLFSDCDGIVNFVKDTIDINDILVVKSDVNINTGNIDFSGDVIIEGDVCEGFSVKSGRNIMINGLVESAGIEAEGDVQIGKGINGTSDLVISVGGDLRCPYIEHTNISVQGDIMAEAIIESNVECYGNIDLTKSGKGILAGGNCNVAGNLSAKIIGNEKERVTVIRIRGTETGCKEELSLCTSKRDELVKNLDRLKNERRKFVNPIKGEANPMEKQLKLLDLTISQCQTEIEALNIKINKLNEQWAVEYNGSVMCTNKMYYGTRVFFGEQRFNFNSDTLERCRIFWDEGEIINGIL